MNPQIPQRKLNTIVTACDDSYFWGAYLLIASIRFNQGIYPIIVFAHGLNQKQVSALEQFGDVKVVSSDKPYLHLSKPDAIAEACTEFISWIDADCIFVGNLDRLLIPANRSFQIRFRRAEENYSVFKNRYTSEDTLGEIPSAILKIWRDDIGERATPRYSTQCVSNCFSFHREHLPYIRRWKLQIERYSAEATSPTNPSSTAYFMSDESVLSSLLCYGHETPATTDYRLGNANDAHLMHFGMAAKPWLRWQKRHLYYYDYVQVILRWALDQGYSQDGLPYSLNGKSRIIIHLHSQVCENFALIRRLLCDVFIGTKRYFKHHKRLFTTKS
ncbi:MAG: hypothetical protein KUG82_16840 [Pseudomonadales bacterium]|nr:hypothetical protein [Pseudomonadales bacterium]